MSDWNKRIIEEFRDNEGNVGGVFEGKPILLLHHTGARTGTERVSPLMVQDLDGRGWAVFASKGGADSHPDWFYNLSANPEARVELGDRTVDVVARVVDDAAERSAIWEPWKRRFPQFADYEARTDREIPVIVLEPVS